MNGPVGPRIIPVWQGREQEHDIRGPKRRVGWVQMELMMFGGGMRGRVLLWCHFRHVDRMLDTITMPSILQHTAKSHNKAPIATVSGCEGLMTCRRFGTPLASTMQCVRSE